VIGSITLTGAQAQKSVDLKAMVERWYAGAAPNFGVLLETAHTGEAVFVSREGGAPAQRPSLRVCYSVSLGDSCGNNPCQNGGTCTNNPNGSYTCTCQPGWDGRNCQHNVDDCAPNPCQHGGVCTDSPGSYTCACQPGYEGTNCQINHNDCAPNPCQHGGTCTNTPTGYTCTCAAGYEGTNCEINHDDCAGNPCHNGGTCIDGVGSFSCSCAPDWGGPTCDVNLDMCAQQPCLNGGTCTNGMGTYTCACQPGYEGTNCQIDIDDCASSPCQHGGTCTDGVNGYSCACLPGYTGTSCEIWCFGRGTEGQLGHGLSAGSLAPVKVIDDVDLVGPTSTPVPHAPIPWVAVSATEYFTCGMRANGQVLCWGGNGNGQLGFGATGNRNQPALVADLIDATAITAGRTHACAVRATGNVACWGSSFALGRTGFDLLVPALIGNATNPFANAVNVSASGFHTCATTTYGRTWCWGQSQQSELGQITPSALPIAIAGPLVDTSSVTTSSGFCHSCTLLEDGRLRCWGSEPAVDICRSQLGWGLSSGSVTPVMPLLPGP